MTFIKEKIDVTAGELAKRMTVSETPVQNVTYIPCGYKQTNTPPPADAGWMPYHGQPLDGPEDSHWWFRFALDVPVATPEREFRLSATTGREGQWDASNPQCTLFVDGDTAYQAFDTNHSHTPLTAGHHEIAIYFYNGMLGGTVSLHLTLKEMDLATEGLWYDLTVPLQAAKCLPADGLDYAEIIRALDRATLFLDFRDWPSAAYDRSVRAARHFMETEFYGKVCGGARGVISMIGHTHIDVAWLWTLAQTREKAQRSFSTVIRLMEKYPDFVFMSSQPQLYRYVKEQDPALYETIRTRVKEGRWEAEGAMWLEADTNIISGESMVRQILLGKRFMREEFGVENRVLWLPDVFGYSAALPQVLKKSGVDCFFTAKLSWCETDKFPHDNFIWRGLDGSEVFVVLSKNYVNTAAPANVMDHWRNHINKTYTNTHVYPLGYGDGGGGTTADMLEIYNRLKRGLPGFPRVEMKPAGEAIRDIEAQFRERCEQLRFVPRWNGELYLEMHRGTYTSQAHNKKNNRQSELLYQTLETLAVTDGLFHADATYPADLLDRSWHTICKNQFHDIIPGSSIRQVYEVSDKEYAALLSAGQDALDARLDALAADMACDRDGYLIYNPAPFAADGVVDTGEGCITVHDIPAHGWQVVTGGSCGTGVTADAHSIRNAMISVTFDDKYHIVSIYDRKNCREVIPGGQSANVLEVYEDYPRTYDAWEITEYYKQKMWVADHVSAVEVINEGNRAGLRIDRAYGHSTITQTITLTETSPRLDFATVIDWHEDHVLLKAAFPVDIMSRTVDCDIQFGHLPRPTHRNTSWDEARFEICAHKWIDLSESGYGVSLLNDCKYGHSVEENIMRISLLKAATYPDPQADRGIQTFTYALYPHRGDLCEGGTIAEAYRLNLPLTARKLTARDGKATVPATYSLVTSTHPAFVVETVKQAEDGDGIILRGYESFGGKVHTDLILGFNVASAELCDLQERRLSDLAADGHVLSVSASNFEILTIRVRPVK